MAEEHAFDFEEEAAASYDPLADFDDGEEAEEDLSDGQGGPVTTARRMTQFVRPDDDRPVEVRIQEVYDHLKPRKRVLDGILRFLDTPTRSDVLQAKVDELQEYDYSVYDGYAYSKLLFRCGAIDKVDENGDPFPEDYEQAPDIIEVDGVRYYQPTDGVLVYWITTPDGWAFLAKDDPEKRMEELLHDQFIYAPIYQTVLGACASPEGASAQLLADLVDNEPLLQTPRRWSSFFTKRLEDCDSIVWRGSWQITPLGRKAQGILTEIIAEAEARAAEEAAAAKAAGEAAAAKAAEEAAAAAAAEAAEAEAAEAAAEEAAPAAEAEAAEPTGTEEKGE